MKQSGEISAVAGLYTQYAIAAWEVYAAIAGNSFEWIELASMDAGILDDVLLGFKDRVLGCQVKDRSDVFSYQSLVNAEYGLLKKMFEGWLKLKIGNPGKLIDVRLLSTQPVSENDTIRSYSGNKKPSFSQFQKDFWDKIKEGKNYNKNWTHVAKELMQLLNCSEDLLYEFIRCTHLSFKYELPKEKDFNPLKWTRMNADCEKIRHFIFDTIGKEKKALKLTYSDFIEKVGFGARLQTYFQHDFFVDDLHYQPIVETIKNLKELTRKYSGGYIGLTGSAGSGKSTLLTKWIHESNDHILRYYAYINKDMTYDSGFRGESKHFLHDIITQIRLELGSQDTIPSSNRLDLTTQLGDELKRFSNDYIETGAKTYIIIDGLDHIEREQKVEYSLLKDLPDPNSIPPGVYFILGSRGIDNLADISINIKQNLKTENRSIEINALSKQELLSIIKSYSSLNLTDEQINLLYGNTLGHPLFLRYTIEKLLSVDESQYDQVISEQLYTGNIDDEYQKFWAFVNKDDEFKNLLGIISRFRFSFFDIDLLELNFSFPESELIKLFKVRHFFNIPEPSKWQYFHNSFKYFLEKITATSVLSGNFNESKDIQFHAQIAACIVSVKSNYRWNLIYHLFKSKQFQEILQVASQNYFRDQWYQFRNTRLIREDIGIAVKASYYQKEVKGLVRYFYAASELRQRLTVFDPSSCYDLYVALGMIDIADSYIFEGKSLLVSKGRALDYALCLIENNELNKARKVFELSEPNFILHHSKEVDTERIMSDSYERINEIELLAKWAVVASNYYTLSQITALLESLNVTAVEEGHSGRNITQTQKGRDLRLIFDSVYAIMDYASKTHNAPLVLECAEYLVNKIGRHRVLVDPLCDILLLNKSEFKPLFEFIEKVITGYEINDDNDSNLTLSLSHLYYFNNIERARAYFDKLKTPFSDKKEDYDKFTNIYYLFNYARLYFILNNESVEDLQKKLPPINNKDEKVTYGYVINIAHQFAILHNTGKTAFSDLSILLKTILVYFHKGFLKIDHTVQNNKCDIIILIIRLAYKDSPSIVSSVLEIIADDWRNYKQYWKSYDIRKIINEVKDDKACFDWCVAELDYLESVMLSSQGPEERSEHCINQAANWLTFGYKEKARVNMQNALAQTLGLGQENDHQLGYLMEWLPIIRKYEESNTRERLIWFLKRMSYIQDISSGDVRVAAGRLLDECLEWNPANGFALAKWLLLNKMIDFSRLVETILEYSVKSDKKHASVYSKLFTRVVLFFQDNSTFGHKTIPEFVTQFSSAGKIKSLIDEVLIYATEQKKNEVIQKILSSSNENGIVLGLKKEDFPVGNHYSSTEYDLELSTGEKLKKEDLIKNITTVADLFDLFPKASPYSNFKWIDLIKKLRAEFSELQWKELLTKKEYDAIELSEIGYVAFDVGFIDFSRDVAYLALKKSKPAGWMEHYDGGSKIKPYKLLAKVEKQDVVSDLVFADLAFSFGEISVKDICDDVLKILELLILPGSSEYHQIYFEVEDHLKALLSNAEIDNEILDLNEHEVKFEELVANFLVFLYEFPVSGIKEHIESLLIESFEDSEKLVTVYLNILFQKQYYQPWLNIINGFVRYHGSISDGYINNIKILTGSDQFDIAFSSAELLENFGIVSDWERSGSSLPLVYQMQFESKPELIVDKAIMLKRLEEREGLRETKDPIEFIGYYESDAKFLSDESEIPLINIAFRIMQFAEAHKLPVWFDKLSEKEILTLFKAIELNVAYMRPRMLRLRRALMKVVNELWNADMISHGLATFISKENDPSISFISPSVRPGFIEPLTGKDNNRTVRRRTFTDKWVNEMGKECFENIKPSANDNLVIAEFTKIISLDHAHPQETRNSFISLKKEIKFEKHIFYESKMVECYLEEYLNYEGNEIICFNYGNSFDPRKKWLAINPAICFMAGWVPALEGLFRWIDKKGNIMVESIYWLDGNTSSHERMFESQAGYGWLVLMKPEAFKTLKKAIKNPIYFHRKCERHYRLIQKRYNTDIDVTNILVDTDIYSA